LFGIICVEELIMDNRRHGAGKGDSYRRVDQEKYAENYKAIFGEFKIKTWNPDEDEDSTDNEENENGN
tara:strand:- start:444 stop:647 length:204 start_codon:yes stop_codon:yes gene_type:complete